MDTFTVSRLLIQICVLVARLRKQWNISYSAAPSGMNKEGQMLRHTDHKNWKPLILFGRKGSVRSCIMETESTSRTSNRPIRHSHRTACGRHNLRFKLITTPLLNTAYIIHTPCHEDDLLWSTLNGRQTLKEPTLRRVYHQSTPRESGDKSKLNTEL